MCRGLFHFEYDGCMRRFAGRALRYVAVTLTVTVAAWWGVSGWVSVYVMPGTGSLFVVEHGSVCFNQRSGRHAYPGDFEAFTKRIPPEDRYWNWKFRRIFTARTTPDWIDAKDIPIWMILAPLLMGTTGLWWGRLKRLGRHRAGQCSFCGYDRRGLAGDAKCPECGKGSAPIK